MPEQLTPNNITEEQLNLGYWYVTHKLLLKRILIIALLAVDAVLVGFSGYGLAVDMVGAPERNAQLAQLVSGGVDSGLIASRAAKPLEISNTQVLAPQGKYDFVATVRNPNPDFAAHFSYRFVASEIATSSAQGFILPNDEKFVVRLGEAMASRPANADLEISNLVWKRIDRHEISDWNSFASEHLDLSVANASYDPAVGLPDGKTIGKTTFAVENRTGFGYYDVKMIVVMYRGAAIAGVNTTVFPELRPSETKRGEVTWYEDLGAVSKIVVMPEIDITNDAVYLRER